MKTFFITAATLLYSIHAVIANNNSISAEQKQQAEQWLQNQQVQFLENKGQISDMDGKLVPFVLFKASAPGMDMYVTEKGLTYLFFNVEEDETEKEDAESFGKEEEKFKMESSRIDVDLKGASIRKENVIKETPSITDFNYFYPHCEEGIYGVKQYEKITIKNIYPNIDWVLYNAEKKGFKYDFIVHPGADPMQIELIYSSFNPVKLNQDGSIEIKTKLGTLTEQAPYSYIKENNQPVTTAFQITNQQHINKEYYQTTINFQLSNFGLSNFQTLVIDPQLVWGTYFAGSGTDGTMSVDCDLNGNVYMTGYSPSVNFPIQNPGGGAYVDSAYSGLFGDMFIIKFSTTGSLIWGTFYGGSNMESGISVKTDATGNIYIAGLTRSNNFPTQAGIGAFTGAYYDPSFGGNEDAFVLRFSPTGICEWGTYYGDIALDQAWGITTDAAGNVYVTGLTMSAGLITQQWGTAYFDNSLAGARDVFILRFSSAGNLDWATYYGGSNDEYPCSIATDIPGNVYVTGYTASSNFPTQPWLGAYYDFTLDGVSDAFVLRFDVTTNLHWATYYGGSDKDSSYSIATDIGGNIYVAGQTASANLTLQPWGGAYFDNSLTGTSDAFILRFSPVGVLDWATYFGGSNREGYISANGSLVIDGCGNIYMSFETSSPDIQTVNPGCGYYYDGTFGGGGVNGRGLGDIFLTEFSSSGQLLWATYVGDSQEEYRCPIALDADNNLYLSGEWINYSSGASLPLMNPGGGAYYYSGSPGNHDPYVVKFSPAKPTQLQVNPICTCNGSATVNVPCALPPVNYIWSSGNQTLNTTNLSNTISNLCAGNYWVEVTDASCNKDTLFFVLIDTSKGPTVIIGPNISIAPGGSTTLTVSGGVNYNWSPVTGLNNPNISNPIANPSVTTQYCVTVTDVSGCTDSACVTVYVETPCPDNLAIPNAFSPNDDGENDEFCLQGGMEDCIKELTIVIYDRWGEKVYESSDKKFCWDGMYLGRTINTSVFVYYMEATLISGNTIEKKGNISLIK